MNKSSFELLFLDTGIDLLRSKVETLSRQKLAALFGSIGAAMLPLYVQFSERNHWGNPSVLRDALDRALGYAAGETDFSGNAESVLEAISKIIPDEEEFEVPLSTFAMDAAICVDVAVRVYAPGYKVESSWIEYALDPIITVLCERQTGYLNLGSSIEEDVWQANALKNSELKAAFEALEEMVELLSGMDGSIGKERLKTLEQLGQQLMPLNVSGL